MRYLLNWRLWVLCGLLVAFPVTYLKGHHDGKKVVQIEWRAAVAKADADARSLEQRRQDAVDLAASKATQRVKVVEADRRRVLNQLDGLRGAVDAAEQSAKESQAAADQYRTTCGKLLVQSGSLLEEIARSADGHASDVRLLLDSWPK